MVVVLSLPTSLVVPPVLALLYAGLRLPQPAQAAPGDMAQEGHLPNLDGRRRAA